MESITRAQELDMSYIPIETPVNRFCLFVCFFVLIGSSAFVNMVSIPVLYLFYLPSPALS